MFTNQAELEQYLSKELKSKEIPEVLLKDALFYALNYLMDVTISDKVFEEKVSKGQVLSKTPFIVMLDFPLATEIVDVAIQQTFEIVRLHPDYKGADRFFRIKPKRMANLRKKKRRKTIQGRCK